MLNFISFCIIVLTVRAWRLLYDYCSIWLLWGVHQTISRGSFALFLSPAPLALRAGGAGFLYKLACNSPILIQRHQYTQKAKLMMWIGPQLLCRRSIFYRLRTPILGSIITLWVIANWTWRHSRLYKLARSVTTEKYESRQSRIVRMNAVLWCIARL